MKKIEFVNGTTINGAETFNQLQENIEKAIEEPKYVNITIGVEFETGRIINNKKEYGIIINCGVLPNKTTKTIDLGFNINNVELTGLNGTAFSNGGYYIAIPYALESDYLRVFIQGNTISIATNADASPYTNSYLTLTYTKK